MALVILNLENNLDWMEDVALTTWPNWPTAEVNSRKHTEYLSESHLDFRENFVMVVSYRFIHNLDKTIKSKRMCSWNLGKIFKKYLERELVFK